MRNNELEILHERFYRTKKEIQQVINYYITRELDGIPEDILPTFATNWENVIESHGNYKGISLEITFQQEGNKQIWIGATHVGNGPFGRQEHYLGYIQIDQVKFTCDDSPVEVRIVSGGWPLFLPFWQGMADYLRIELGQRELGYLKFSYSEGESANFAYEFKWPPNKIPQWLEAFKRWPPVRVQENSDGTLFLLETAGLRIPLEKRDQVQDFEVKGKLARVTRSIAPEPAQVIRRENYTKPIVWGTLTDREVTVVWDRHFDGCMRGWVDELKRLHKVEIVDCNPSDLLETTAYPTPAATPGSYDLQKIRNLLNDVFSENDLRDFCLYEADFRPVHDDLKDSDRKTDILRRLIDYARQKELVARLLDEAKKKNRARYEQYERDNPGG